MSVANCPCQIFLVTALTVDLSIVITNSGVLTYPPKSFELKEELFTYTDSLRPINTATSQKQSPDKPFASKTLSPAKHRFNATRYTIASCHCQPIPDTVIAIASQLSLSANTATSQTVSVTSQANSQTLSLLANTATSQTLLQPLYARYQPNTATNHTNTVASHTHH